MFIAGLVSILGFFSHLVISKPTVDGFINQLESNGSSLLRYPTQFSQGIVPKQIHSHNDYWRDVPFYSALSHGVASVEADVWLKPDTQELFVGHEVLALTPQRTFQSLYLDPIMDTIKRQNPPSPIPNQDDSKIQGVFDTDGGQTLILFVDHKTEGNSTLAAVVQALEPLQNAGYLTTWDGETLKQGAVTVIGTGNTPLAGILSLPFPRYIFFDAVLPNLTNTPDPFSSKETFQFNSSVSPIASVSWKKAVGWNGLWKIGDDQLARLRQQIKQAHDRGIQTRYWDTPGWPIMARNAIWKLTLEEGSDWLNCDDLRACSTF